MCVHKQPCWNLGLVSITKLHGSRTVDSGRRQQAAFSWAVSDVLRREPSGYCSGTHSQEILPGQQLLCPLSHRLGCTMSVGLGAEDPTWHTQHIPSPCTQGVTAPWPCLGPWTLCKALWTSDQKCSSTARQCWSYWESNYSIPCSLELVVSGW